MPRSRSSSLLAVLAPVVALAACKSGGDATCINPADPACVTVATVDVFVESAPEDTVVQIGSSVQMDADVEDTGGAPVTTLQLAWTSATPATATVGGGNGLVL